MTDADYAKLATAIRSYTSYDHMDGIRDIVETVCEVMSKADPHFDSSAFKSECMADQLQAV